MQQKEKEKFTKSLVSSYCYFGLGERLDPLMSSQKRFLTSIYLVEKQVPTAQEFEIFDIFGEGKIYLLCIFNEQNQNPITNIGFSEVSVDERNNQIKFDYHYRLCRIDSNLNVMQSVQVCNWDKERNRTQFDLSPYMKNAAGKCFVICYSRKENRLPIINLIFENHEENNNSINLVQFDGYSPKQLNMIRQKNKVEQIYKPELLDFYPLCFGECQRDDCTYYSLNNNETLDKAVMPEGIQLTQQKKESQCYYQKLTAKDQPLYIYILQYYEEISQKQSLNLGIEENSQKKYIPYVIALASFHFFPAQFFDILQYLFTEKDSYNFGFLVHQLIYQPQIIVQKEKYFLTLQINQIKIAFQKHVQFPNCDLKSIRFFFKKINLYNIIQLYSAVLTGRRIRLLSNSIPNPGQAIDVLLTLLYPIEYKGLIQCYLSQDETKLFESLYNCYIFGAKEIFQQPDCDYYSYKFNLDCNIARHICPPSELPHTEKLMKKLEPYINKAEYLTEKDTICIREIFFKVNIKLLKEAFSLKELKIKQEIHNKQKNASKKVIYKSPGLFWDEFLDAPNFVEFWEQYKPHCNFGQFEEIFKSQFKQIHEDHQNRIHADINFSSIISQNNLFQKKVITSPLLTPKYLVQKKEMILQEQVYRMWHNIVQSFNAPNEYQELENILKTEIYLQDIFHQNNKHVEINKKGNLDDILLSFPNKCPKCQNDMKIEEILQRMPISYLKTTVPCLCGQEIQPRMFIEGVGEFELMNLHLLQFQFPTLDLFNQEFHNTEQFWNLYFYFRLFQLPIPFINEYDETAYCRQQIKLRKEQKVSIYESLQQMQTKKVIKTEIMRVTNKNK